MQCRTCGKEILFIRMKGRPRPMPADAEPVSVLIRDNGYPFFQKDGTMVRGFKIGDAWDDDPDANVMEAYESHFATCNDAISWRRRKNMKGAEKHETA